MNNKTLAFKMNSIRNDSFVTATHTQLVSLMEAAGDAVFWLDQKGQIVSVSKRTTELINHPGAITGQQLSDLVHLPDRVAILNTLNQTLATRLPVRVNVRLTTHAAERWFEFQINAYVTDQGESALLVVGRDISAQQATEERLRHMATHDALTGLPNSSLLSDRIHMATAQSRRTGEGYSLVTLNIDGFKKVNDALGHGVGDALLRVAGQRLRTTLRDVDTLARIGGDEFIAVLPSAVDEPAIQLVGRRLIAALQQPFEIQGHILYVSASIGVATYPAHGDTEVILLAHADLAMYRAKETGKARCVIYNHEKFTLAEHDVSMEAAMFEGVRNGEFLLHYQPIVDAHTREVLGFEALMRWMRPDIGLVPPVQFIPMAESNGLINFLGSWALRVACLQLKLFQEVSGRRLYVSVNVSPRQFRNDQFLNVLDDAIKSAGLQGDQLLLEITEGILMSDPEHAEALLTAIAARGVRIAIDDFGTGYSSLAYLKRFPINTLKIDRAFVKDLPESVKDAAICNVVLSLANHLNLSTVAEGVETEEQLTFLATQGCTLIQGYHTGRPGLPDVAIKLLQTILPPAVMPLAVH